MRKLKLITTRITLDTEDKRVLCEAHAAESPLTEHETETPAPDDNVCEMCAAGEPVRAPARAPKPGLLSRFGSYVLDRVFGPLPGSESDPDRDERAAGSAMRKFDDESKGGDR